MERVKWLEKAALYFEKAVEDRAAHAGRMLRSVDIYYSLMLIL